MEVIFLITDFISDIENDSTLGFKIEEFKMIPAEIMTYKQHLYVKKLVSKEISAK